MRKLILLLLFIPLVSFGQQLSFEQQKKVLFGDVNLIKDKTITIAKAIDYYTEMDLEMIRFENNNNSIFKEDDSGKIMIVFVNKILSNPYGNTPYFNAFGGVFIYKRFIAKSKDYNAINNIIEIQTEVTIDEMNYMSDSNADFWKNKYKQIKSDFINEFSNNSYYKIEESKSYDFVDNINERQYNIIDNFVFSNGNSSNNFIYRFAIGKDSKGRWHQTIYYTIYFQSTAIDSNNQLDRDLKLKEKKFIIGDIDLRKINNYDLKAMINFFLEDVKRNNIIIKSNQNIKAIFEPLEGSTIALAYGSGDDSNILIKVDPEKWAISSEEKRWYILYHELGHDVLNLEHGEGGKMMFNFADKEYSWDDFIEDKEYMLSNN